MTLPLHDAVRPWPIHTPMHYYVRHAAALCLPGAWHRLRRDAIRRQLDDASDPEALLARAAYYNHAPAPFPPPADVQPFRLQLLRGRSRYQLDLHEHLRHFDPALKLAYLFGDQTRVPPRPTVVKSRPIDGDNAHAILINLNKLRHFVFVNDRRRFRDKRDAVVWRGRAQQPDRQAFLARFHDQPRCDVGHHHSRHRDTPWTEPRLSLRAQLRYRYALALEGNDVASNLKWIMGSNSLCLMPPPRYETWFMEGRLIPGRHYVALQPDCADLIAKMDHYSAHPDAAEAIIDHAHRWVAQFQNPATERLVALLVLWKYFFDSGQLGPPPGWPWPGASSITPAATAPAP